MRILQAVSFSDRIAPASPIHTKPIVSPDAGFGFELKSSKWSAAVRSSGALDLPENVQFRHRHSFLGSRTRRRYDTNATPFLTYMRENLFPPGFFQRLSGRKSICTYADEAMSRSATRRRGVPAGGDSHDRRHQAIIFVGMSEEEIRKSAEDRLQPIGTSE